MDMRRSQWECEVTWQAWTNFWFPATVNCHQAASMFYTTRRSGIPKKEFGTSWCVSSIVYGGLGQSWHVRMEPTLIRGFLMAEPALTRPHTLTEKQAKLQRSGDGWPRPAKCLTQWPMSPRAQPCQSKKLGEVMSERMGDKLPQILIKSQLPLWADFDTSSCLAADSEMKLLPCVATIAPTLLKTISRLDLLSHIALFWWLPSAH